MATREDRYLRNRGCSSESARRSAQRYQPNDVGPGYFFALLFSFSHRSRSVSAHLALGFFSRAIPSTQARKAASPPQRSSAEHIALSYSARRVGLTSTA